MYAHNSVWLVTSATRILTMKCDYAYYQMYDQNSPSGSGLEITLEVNPAWESHLLLFDLLNAFWSHDFIQAVNVQ